MKMEYARMEYAEKQFKKWARFCCLLSETITPEGVPNKVLKKLAQSHRIYNHYYAEYRKSLRESIVETEKKMRNTRAKELGDFHNPSTPLG